MQAKLPDINAGFVKYRSYSLVSFELKNYAAATLALNNMNAFLPDAYKVEINTNKYNEMIQTKLSVVCGNCGVETNRNDLGVMNLLSPMLIGCVSGIEYEKVWVCTHCHKDNKLAETKMIEDGKTMPYYLKVVPEPPVRHDGLQGDKKFHINFKNWFCIYLEELEYQLGLYRVEYINEMQADLDELNDGGFDLAD